MYNLKTHIRYFELGLQFQSFKNNTALCKRFSSLKKATKCVEEKIVVQGKVKPTLNIYQIKFTNG